MTSTTQPNMMDVKNLDFDRENPRLVEFEIGDKTTDKEILKHLWEVMDVEELVQSIAASGYFPHEPLIVARGIKGRHVVIEGNRRLAAVRLLRTPELREKGWNIPNLTQEKSDALCQVPVILSTREEAWPYLGVKHINGPARWSSYAKARYIAHVHGTFGVALEQIASQIGDKFGTVQKLYQAMMVIEQAEREGVFNREDAFRSRLPFSHLQTALGYKGYSEFLALRSQNEETNTPVPPERINHLGELCRWLFGSRKEKIPPLIESQNPDLRNLDTILKHREALAAIRQGVSLNQCLELTRPASAVLEESLLAAKRELQRAHSYLTTGDDKSSDLLRIAGTVATLADDLYGKMERARLGDQKPKRLTE
ncbi:MAG: ParB N-terminal domain-containing protein [Magnetococcales bacterium]|nr:ParB N-terminal domain-containing protein [Magnetococcales bacterium]